MTNEELTTELEKLTKEFNDLHDNYYRDEFTDLKVFRKKSEFKGDIKNIEVLEKTGGTSVIADGDHTAVIGAGGGSITITTKNGIITSIT